MMTYQELLAEIQVLMDADDFKGVVQLITPENVETALKCSGEALVAEAQPLNDPKGLLDEYLFIVGEISKYTLAEDVIDWFQPQNVLYAQVGNEYETILPIAEQIFTDDGYADPEGTAETRVGEDYTRLLTIQTTTSNDVC